MESNRPHSSHPITTNDQQQQQQLFLCFSSRLSSSSAMKISKSILSPGRSAREISLSSSLSRRLKTNGSIKGAQSPMFPVTTTNTVRKKTGVGFENPEPSSPKVTCIGQVRVKSKKKKTSHHHQHHHHRSSNTNNIRSRSQSQRRSASDSFRRFDTSAGAEDGNNGLKRQSSTSYRNREIELESSHRHGHNNQKWVHIPVTICDSLRSFGSDFNCFLPCKSSSCISNKQHHRHHQQQQQREAEKQLGCGSVLAKWLVTVQDGEVGQKGRRQIELVVGGVDDDDEELCGRRSYRKRNVMEDIDIKEIERNLNEKVGSLDRRDEIVDGGRLSICVPPKNALLLMRCGSDPVKMAALANRLWEPPENEEHVYIQEDEEDVGGADRECETEQNAATNVVSEFDKQVTCSASDVREDVEESVSSDSEMKCEDENIVRDHDVVTGAEPEHINMEILIPLEIEAERDTDEDQDAAVEEMMDDAVDGFEEADQLLTSPSSEQEREDRGDIMLPEQSKHVVDYSDEEMNAEKERSALPDCLLMMMCEPKLSMEVSQETWVCTTDFIRCQPSREVNKKIKKTHDGGSGGGRGEELSKRVSIHCKPPTAPPRKSEENPRLIPHRSSCSYPRHESAREPLYNLTRCKSEPRKAVAKLAAAGTPESWKK